MSEGPALRMKMLCATDATSVSPIVEEMFARRRSTKWRQSDNWSACSEI